MVGEGLEVPEHLRQEWDGWEEDVEAEAPHGPYEPWSEYALPTRKQLFPAAEGEGEEQLVQFQSGAALAKRTGLGSTGLGEDGRITIDPYHRWALDISIITADEAYLRYFKSVLYNS